MATNQRFKERFIGEGAMGDVFELEGHKPPAVIKKIKNEKDHEMFKKECEALNAVYHANVVRVLYKEENGRELGIVMEYCQRGSLRDVIFNPKISYSMNTVLTWAIQLFDAIDHMYQKHKLVHRDIKPDNIFVTDVYQLKIGDFGLVKVVENGTITGTFVGTQRYMSPPELIENHIRDVYDQIKDPDIRDSHRNDVYSLGLVVWEIIERRKIFLNYVQEGAFNRDALVLDIGLKRVTKIESPECQSEIQKIILRCTNFQRTRRPPASEVFDFLTQTQKANQFISSLPLKPTKYEDQKKLMKPIGFDDRTEWVLIESEERKYEKRFDGASSWEIPEITRIMRDKLGTLNSAEKEKFFKEAPNIVSRLKEETQTFKDARYVIDEILTLEEEKGNLHKKDIYEIFELFVLGDFRKQLRQENYAFVDLKSHEKIWISSFQNWWWCEISINSLKEIRREKYTTDFYFRCFVSQSTGEGWIHIGKDEFVSEDLRLWKQIPGQWVDNPRAKFGSYGIENEDKKHEVFHFSHYEQIPLERIIEAFQKQQKRMGTIIKLHLEYLIPIEGSEKNNVSFNIESSLDASSESPYGPHPFPRYIFQLRNPPRSICQKNHSGQCQMDGFRKMRRSSELSKELHIPVCGEITREEVVFLDSYRDCIRFNSDKIFQFMTYPFLFLCGQNLLDIPFLILLDHPNNYENGESIPGLDLKMKLHHIDVGVLREYFQESKLNERVYALIEKDRHRFYIRLVDYQGKPITEWLEFEKVTEWQDFKGVAKFGFLCTDQEQKLDLVVEDNEVAKKERQRKNAYQSMDP